MMETKNGGLEWLEHDFPFDFGVMFRFHVSFGRSNCSTDSSQECSKSVAMSFCWLLKFGAAERERNKWKAGKPSLAEKKTFHVKPQPGANTLLEINAQKAILHCEIPGRVSRMERHEALLLQALKLAWASILCKHLFCGLMVQKSTCLYKSTVLF